MQVVVVNDASGRVIYVPRFIVGGLYDELVKTVPWKEAEVKLLGKVLHPKRRVTAFGSETKTYHYSGSDMTALNWADYPIIKNLHNELESRISGVKFNYCLTQWYYSEESKLGWHADSITDLVPDSWIASLSFGTSRHFYIKPNKDTTYTPLSDSFKLDRFGRIDIMLNDGDLLLMDTRFNLCYKHMLNKQLKADPSGGRVNLTFRLLH